MWCGLEQNDHSEFMGVILAMEKLIMRQKKQSGEGNRKKKKQQFTETISATMWPQSRRQSKRSYLSY